MPEIEHIHITFLQVLVYDVYEVGKLILGIVITRSLSDPLQDMLMANL